MMIVVLTLLILSFMQAVFLYMKVSNQITKQHEAFYQLEAVANKLAAEIYDADCVVTAEDPNQVIEMLLQSHGCSLTDNHHYFSYLIDDLGVIPCLYILSGKEHYSSHHWLVTVATGPPKQEIMQLRIARPVKTVTCEFNEARQINQGIISWRYLPSGMHHHG